MIMELFDSLLIMLNEMSPYILLGFLIAGLMHAFVPERTMARHLSGTGWRPVVKSALIGIPLPLCSCGVLPTAIAMRRGGASRASSTSFLVATPQTGVDSIAATWSLLGPAFAVIRPVAALVTAVFGGIAVGKTEKAGHCSECIGDDAAPEYGKKSFGAKLADAFRYGYIDLVASIGGWLVAGLVIAALITVYVPSDFFSALGATPILSMLAVLVVAIPMYVCATGSIPIAMSLIMKGLSPGTALVLLMAGPAANFASFTLVSKEMGRKAALIYLGAIITGAIVFGLLIDYALPSQWFVPGHMHGLCGHEAGLSLFKTVCSGILSMLLLYAFIRRKKHNHKHIKTEKMTEVYQIKGMNCPHCQASVAKAIASVEGVENVDVNLGAGTATVDGNHDPEKIIAAVHAAGFEACKG